MFSSPNRYSYFCRKKSDSESSLAITSGSELSRAIKLGTRAKECSVLAGQHDEDIAKIREALKQCDKDVIATNNENKLEQRLISYQFFVPAIPKNIQFGRLENRIDMADTITDLLNHYPSLSKGSLDDLNASWHDWEEHHTKVIALVKDYLPETYACLNESKIRQDPGRLVV